MIFEILQFFVKHFVTSLVSAWLDGLFEDINGKSRYLSISMFFSVCNAEQKVQYIRTRSVTPDHDFDRDL